MNLWKPLCIVCIIIIVFLVFDKMVNNRSTLKGVWTATTKFCADSGISSMMLKIDNDLKGGTLVIVADDQKSLLCNSTFSIKGWSILPPKNNKHFVENIKFTFDETSPIPSKCILEYKDNTIYIKTNEKLYAELVKLSL